MAFNVFTEAKNVMKNVMEWAQQNGYTRDELEAKDFMELYNEYVCDTNDDYVYSVYTADLFNAVVDDMDLLSYCEEVESEFGQGIATNPMLINDAIKNYILDYAVNQDSYNDALDEYFPKKEED